MIEARRHPRYQMEADVRVYLRNTAVVPGPTVDISESGVPAMLRDEVPGGEVGRLDAVPTGDVVIHALTRQRNAFRMAFNSSKRFRSLRLSNWPADSWR